MREARTEFIRFCNRDMKRWSSLKGIPYCPRISWKFSCIPLKKKNSPPSYIYRTRGLQIASSTWTIIKKSKHHRPKNLPYPKERDVLPSNLSCNATRQFAPFISHNTVSRFTKGPKYFPPIEQPVPFTGAGANYPRCPTFHPYPDPRHVNVSGSFPFVVGGERLCKGL